MRRVLNPPRVSHLPESNVHPALHRLAEGVVDLERSHVLVRYNLNSFTAYGGALTIDSNKMGDIGNAGVRPFAGVFHFAPMFHVRIQRITTHHTNS